ncbi:hypothetical protein D3C77_292170 [compost metagenome]
MSLPPPDMPRQGKAEQAFRRAFERLKNGTPLHTPKGTAVTQNNVARESGLDPSALKKSRFPELIAEIQAWVQSNAHTATAREKSQVSQRNRNRTLREQLDAMKTQRDKALGLLADADETILEMSHEIERLKRMLPASTVKVLPIGRKP